MTLDARTERIISQVADVLPPIVDAICRPGPHCVLSSALGQMVLARFSITAKPWPCTLRVANHACATWEAEGRPGGAEEACRRGAYLITNSPNDPMGDRRPVFAPWDGHLVLRVGHRLIDLNVGAFTRPDHDIQLPQAMTLQVMREEAKTTWHPPTGGPVQLHYRPLEGPIRNAYRTAKDWTQRERLRPELLEVISRIRS